MVRLVKKHPLPDGNKRSAWVALRMFVEINGWRWATAPTVDEAEAAMVSIATGSWDDGAVAEWLGRHLVSVVA